MERGEGEVFRSNEQPQGFFGMAGMDRVPNVWIREFYKVMKEVDERIDESVLKWFGQIEIMGNDRIAKMMHLGDCVESCLVGRWRKWSTDSGKY